VKGRFTQAAPLCSALLIAATFIVRAGWDAAMPVALIFAVALVILLLPMLGRLARVLLAIFGLALVLASPSVRMADVDFEAALFVFSFVLATGLLREIALRDPDLQRFGAALVSVRGAYRFSAISLYVFLSGLTLLVGALQFMVGLVSERNSSNRQSERMSLLRAGLAGYVLIPLLSPLAIPFIVVSSMVPNLIWIETLPILLGIATTSWVILFLQDRISADALPTSAATVKRPDGTFLVKALAVVGPTTGLYWLFDLRLGDAALAAISIAAVLWALKLEKGASVLIEGVVSARNEAVIIGASVATGLVLVSIVPAFGAGVGLHELHYALVPPLVLATFIIPGFVGVQPAVCFMLITPAIAPFLTESDTAVPVLAAVIAGWALNSITSPFGLPILVVARAAAISPIEFLVRRNGIATIVMPVLAAAVLFLAAV